MKKLLTLAAFMLLTLTAGAQSIVGTWKLTGEYAKELQKSIGDDEVDASFGFEFGSNTVKGIIWISGKSDEVSMDMVFKIPGTYTKTGQTVVCSFEKENMEFEILDLKSEDPDMKPMLEDPTTKGLVLNLVKEQMKKEFSEEKDDFYELFENIDKFTVKSLTQNQLVIEVEDVEITFERK